MGRLEISCFTFQFSRQVILFCGRNPLGLTRMVADEKPPDGQPKERQDALEDQHLLPAVTSQQPTRDGCGTGHGQRLAEQPVGIGARAFATGKPIGQQHERRRKNRAFGNAQKKRMTSNSRNVCDISQPTAKIPHAESFFDGRKKSPIKFQVVWSATAGAARENYIGLI